MSVSKINFIDIMYTMATKKHRRRKNRGGENKRSTIRANTLTTRFGKGVANLLTKTKEERDRLTNRLFSIHPSEALIKIPGIHYERNKHYPTKYNKSKSHKR